MSGGGVLAIGTVLMLGGAALLFGMVTRFLEPSLLLSFVAYGASLLGGVFATAGVAQIYIARRRR